MNTKYTYSDNNDFGFSDFIDVPDSISDECKDRLQKIEDLILPLLNNLMLNPNSPIIKWPNREVIIKEKIKELLSLTRG